MKTTSQDTISYYEQQIIELQRKLDKARKLSTSIWCQIFDELTASPEEEPAAMADKISTIIAGWASSQRERINRNASTMGIMPPYSDCLNDLIVSASNPDSEPDIPEPSEAPFTGSELPGEPVGSRVPPPPLPPVPAAGDGLSVGPPKMMRVNVPRPHQKTSIPPTLDE